MGAIVNGWIVTKGLRDYGANYMKRAVVAAYRLAGKQAAGCGLSVHRSRQRRKKAHGRKQVQLTLPKRATPPLKGFWSITMYQVDTEGGWC